MGSRRRSRELALQLLYQYELTKAVPEDMEAHFEEWQSANEDVQSFADRLLRGTLDHAAEIDLQLEEQTSHWRLARRAGVAREILRVALYELIHQPETPPAVVIDEAIEIAKKFGAEGSARFVNGVLDGFVKRKTTA